MNCRSFERQTADWLSQRLSPEQSGAMAAHRETCAACARAAAMEAQVRGAWQESKVSPPVADLWPRIAARLDAPGPSVVRAMAPHSRTRWALAAAFCLLALGLFRGGMLSSHRTLDERMPSERIATLSGSKARPDAAPREADAWVALHDAPQSNPRVDDPVGANMENVWTYLKPENK